MSRDSVITTGGNPSGQWAGRVQEVAAQRREGARQQEEQSKADDERRKERDRKDDERKREKAKVEAVNKLEREVAEEERQRKNMLRELKDRLEATASLHKTGGLQVSESRGVVMAALACARSIITEAAATMSGTVNKHKVGELDQMLDEVNYSLDHIGSVVKGASLQAKQDQKLVAEIRRKWQERVQFNQDPCAYTALLKLVGNEDALVLCLMEAGKEEKFLQAELYGLNTKGMSGAAFIKAVNCTGKKVAMLVATGHDGGTVYGKAMFKDDSLGVVPDGEDILAWDGAMVVTNNNHVELVRGEQLALLLRYAAPTTVEVSDQVTLMTTKVPGGQHQVLTAFRQAQVLGTTRDPANVSLPVKMANKVNCRSADVA